MQSQSLWWHWRLRLSASANRVRHHEIAVECCARSRFSIPAAGLLVSGYALGVAFGGPLLAFGPPVEDEHLYLVVDVLDVVAKETGKTIPEIALNWLLQRPTVSSVIVGARNEEQLRQNFGAVGWSLAPDQVAKRDEASSVTAPYPYFPYRRQEGFARLYPPLAG